MLAVSKTIAIGINGLYYRQTTDDRLNGAQVKDDASLYLHPVRKSGSMPTVSFPPFGSFPEDHSL
jgi:hypothetical protein